jgi:plastocyanin
MIKRALLTVSLLALPLLAAPASDAPYAGTIAGRVLVFDHGKPVQRDDVWVYLEDVRHPRTHAAANVSTAEIRQQGCQFSPHVLVVPVGTTVAFPNYDREEHNVFSPTDPPGQFDLGRYNTDHKGKLHEFDDAGEMEIYCDIHKQMWARVKVVESSIMQKVVDGQFTLRDVPAGTYKLHAWTYDSAEVVDRVVVTDGATVTTSDQHLQLGAPKLHVRKDGTSYPSGQYVGCQ